MRSLILALCLIGSGAHAADSCPRYCNPEVSKPCGAACISKDRTCRKPWTTSCVGVRPDSSGPAYEKPKFVTEVPK